MNPLPGPKSFSVSDITGSVPDSGIPESVPVMKTPESFPVLVPLREITGVRSSVGSSPRIHCSVGSIPRVHSSVTQESASAFAPAPESVLSVLSLYLYFQWPEGIWSDDFCWHNSGAELTKCYFTHKLFSKTLFCFENTNYSFGHSQSRNYIWMSYLLTKHLQNIFSCRSPLARTWNHDNVMWMAY